jgi:hypothetical protein
MVYPLLVDKLTDTTFSGVDRLKRPAIELVLNPYFRPVNIAVDIEAFIVDCEHCVSP